MLPTSKDELVYLLGLKDSQSRNELIQKAYQQKVNTLGNTVYLRGLIEFSNICYKDCYYCGIRKSNIKVNRYLMTIDEILNSAKWAFDKGYGSIVLQCGERKDKNFINFIESILNSISIQTSNEFRVTLSCGEQTKETYKRWFDAGAARYLLRIESSNKRIYESLHPQNHSYNNRVACLNFLKEIGYQVGTGIMIGLPNQMLEDLASDIIFFNSIEADMIGMGPYIPHSDTPIFPAEIQIVRNKIELYNLSLKMIALTRITIPKINIAAATAFQALYPFGREQAILSGANVFMPNISEAKYRNNYRLYENKPCVGENTFECFECVENRIKGIGESIAYFENGDSRLFYERVNKSISS